MIVSAHQPHFMPWLGYLDKMAKSDVFVIMDSLQYEVQNFQNRQKLKFQKGASWLTVPLIRGNQADSIIEKKIDNSQPPKNHWQRLHWLTIESNYKKAAYYEEFSEMAKTIYSQAWEDLVDLNLHVLSLARNAFGINTPVIRSSSLNLEGQKTDMIIDMCRKVGADAYLSGNGGSSGGYKGRPGEAGYLDINVLKNAGIEVLWQEFDHPTHPQLYSQHGFVPKLGYLDYLFNCGKQASIELLSENKLEARI